MWIAMNDGFVSIVADRQRPGNLLVRARRREHVLALFPDLRPAKTPKSDYRWRVSQPAELVALAVSSRLLAVDYGNFKDSVKDDDLHRMYALWWGDHVRLQDGKRPEFS